MNKNWKLISAALLATALASGAQASTVTLNAIADGNFLQGSAFGGPDGVLASEFGTSGTGSIWSSVLKFDLSSLAGLNVSSATLNLTSVLNHSSSAYSHQVYSSTDDSWTEATLTGQNFPASLTLLSATSIDGTSQTYSWDVLSGVTGSNGLLGSNSMLTLFITPDLSQAGTDYGPHFNDRTALDGAPSLTLNVSAVPEPESWSLFALGLAGIGALARKRKMAGKK